jgi:hypothetical protein
MIRILAWIGASLALIPAGARGVGGAGSEGARPLRVSLLEPGEYHGGEVEARTGERWLGLFATRRRTVLATTTLKVQWVHDEIVDDDSRAKSGRRVRVQGRAQPVFVVRSAGALRPGPVTSARRNRDTVLTDGSQLRLRLGTRRYLLRVDTRRGRRSDEGISPDARLVLTEGKSGQVLYRPSDWGEPTEPGEWHLRWAGDLDRDGKLDLYLEVTWHYNLSQRMLFLSSAARPGRLLRRVGLFESVGC